MKKKISKILGVGLAVSLVLSLMVMAAPVGADPAVTKIDGCLREVHVTTAFANAEWVTTPVKYTGGSSAELTDGNEAYEEAAVLMCYDNALSTLTTALAAATYTYWISTTAAHDLAAVLYVDTDGDGFLDVILHSTNIPCGGGGAAFAEYAPTNNWAAKNVNVANPTYPGFGMWWKDGSGYTEPTAGTATFKPLAAWDAVGGVDQTDAVLCVGAATVGLATTNKYYVDGIDIGTAEYDLEPGDCGVRLVPDIAYNVKTATERFTVVDCCGPVSGNLVASWDVETGCAAGAGEAKILPGTGADGQNYADVRMLVKGDAHISAWVDTDGDGVFETEVIAEKKWGEIYCTELESEEVSDNVYDVTETVKAAFLWQDCTAIEYHVADDAVVDWWLMDIGALAAVEALEAALGDDPQPCDEPDGGCGTYVDDFFWYDVNGNGAIETAEKFDTPGAALLAIYAANLVTDDTESYINVSGNTDETTSSGVDGKTTVVVHVDAPDSVILVTLTDYPVDKHGENTVCVQHETWVVIPPPTIEKLPNILWAGEKDVIEWRLDAGYVDYLVAFYLEDPSVGTFEATAIPADPAIGFPWPGFAYKDTAWAQVAPEGPSTDRYGVARVVLHSNKQGKSNVVAVLLGYEWKDGDTSFDWVGAGGILAQQGFIIYFLAFEEVVLVNLDDDDPTNDVAWLDEGEIESDLGVNDSSLLRLRVKGYFEDPVMSSPRPAKPQDIDGDGITDIILPEGRWILPDDYPTLAFGKLLWDLMDTPVDDIVSWLDQDSDKLETLGFEDNENTKLGLPTGVPAEVGAYGDGALFESPLFDDTLTAAQRWAAYLANVKAFGPVIGPFSKLEPVNDDGTSWDVTQQPAVPADGNPIDAFVPEVTTDWRTTVVPDGLTTEEDANMPPAEILFVVTDGLGILADVNKADLYQRPETGVFGTLSVDGVVYTNPYYWQEIPANPIIPPMVGTGLAGYEWDSWDLDSADPAIDGPFRFWDELTVWTADEVNAMNIFGLTTVPTGSEILKTYTDNRGEAWVEFTQKHFEGSKIEAVATYPYLIGDHLPVVSNPVLKLSVDEKDIKLFVDDVMVDTTVDPIRKMLYVFVRNYDGTPAPSEKVEWLIEGPWGAIESLLAGTDEGSINPDYPDGYWDPLDAFIHASGLWAVSSTRVMTSSEITEFVAAGVFATSAVADDYAIAGIKVLSSFEQDVNISIKVHDVWAGEVIIIALDKMVTGFGDEVPLDDILAYYRTLTGDPLVADLADVVAAANDWLGGVIPPDFTVPITIGQLTQLANEWLGV